MRRPARHIGLGKRVGVSIYIPPAYAIDLADDRTDGIVSYYLATAGSGGLTREMEYLRTLVRSAYLQGVNDLIAAGIQKGLFKE